MIREQIDRSDSRPEAHVELMAAVNWRISSPFAPAACSLAESVRLLAGCAGAQLRGLRQRCGELPRDYAVCTTMLTSIVTNDPSLSAILVDGIEQDCGVRPLGIIAGYECTGWAGALRFFARHTGAKRVMLTIVDPNLQNFETMYTTLERTAWGRSTFGVTALLFALPADGRPEVTLGRGPGFAQLPRAIRERHAAGIRRPIFFPFLRGDFRRMMERSIGKDILSPDRYDEYGHCFGADPWIGVIERIQRARPAAAETVTVTSVAHSGYYALCDVTISPDTQVELRSIAGDDDTLQRVIGEAPDSLRIDSLRIEG